MTTRKASRTRPTTTAEPRAEYRLDYSKSRSNRFAKRMDGQAVAIVLDPDVSSVFRSSREVNDALRALIHALPRQPASR